MTNLALRARRKAWLTVYAGDDLKQRIQDAAHAAGKSDSQFCAEILERYVDGETTTNVISKSS